MRNNEFMKMMTLSSTQGNGALLELSQKAVSEAQSMKAITVVALVYIPASFVAVRKSMFLKIGNYWLKISRLGLLTNGLCFHGTATRSRSFSDEWAIALRRYNAAFAGSDHGSILLIRSH